MSAPKFACVKLCRNGANCRSFSVPGFECKFCHLRGLHSHEVLPRNHPGAQGCLHCLVFCLVEDLGWDAVAAEAHLIEQQVTYLKIKFAEFSASQGCPWEHCSKTHGRADLEYLGTLPNVFESLVAGYQQGEKKHSPRSSVVSTPSVNRAPEMSSPAMTALMAVVSDMSEAQLFEVIAAAATIKTSSKQRPRRGPPRSHQRGSKSPIKRRPRRAVESTTVDPSTILGSDVAPDWTEDPQISETSPSQ
jgi:hypothetical protein